MVTRHDLCASLEYNLQEAVWCLYIVVPGDDRLGVVWVEITGMEKSEALLGQLETRMEALTGLVGDLRKDNTALNQRLAEGLGQQARLEQENADLQADKQDLTAEKEKTIKKLETLLARFNGMGNNESLPLK
jgi:septal ring factor EnvC (AmiA/AmiB activator)